MVRRYVLILSHLPSNHEFIFQIRQLYLTNVALANSPPSKRSAQAKPAAATWSNRRSTGHSFNTSCFNRYYFATQLLVSYIFLHVWKAQVGPHPFRGVSSRIALFRVGMEVDKYISIVALIETMLQPSLIESSGNQSLSSLTESNLTAYERRGRCRGLWHQ